MSTAVPFNAWCDQLLSALAAHDDVSPNEKVDLAKLADSIGGTPRRGFVAKAAIELEDRRFIELDRPPIGFGGTDEHWLAKITGAGLAYVEERSVPASDRFVTLDHNDPQHMEAVAALSKLEAEVRTSNSFLANAEERQAVADEVTGLRRLLVNAKVRVAAVAGGGVALLSFIAKASAEGVVAEYAVRALSAVRALLGL